MNNSLIMLQRAIDAVLPNPWITTIQDDWKHNPDILIVDDPGMQCNGPCGTMGFFSIKINSNGKIKFGNRSGHRVRKVTQANCDHFASVVRKQALHLNAYIANK